MELEYRQEIDREIPKDDSTSLAEKMLLYWLIRDLRPTTVIETGTHRALTSLYMAHALYDNQHGHMTTCDPNPEWGSQGNIDKFPALQPYMTFILGKGKDLEIKNIDFAFIDGFHGFVDVIEEVNMLLPKLAENAVVVFHDCWYGNTDGVNEALESVGLETVWLPTKNAIRIYSKQQPKRRS